MLSENHMLRILDQNYTTVNWLFTHSYSKNQCFLFSHTHTGKQISPSLEGDFQAL